MDPQEIFQISQKYRGNPSDEETLNCRNLFNQLRSSSEPIPGLIEIFNAFKSEDDKFEYYNYQRMILEILKHRIKYYLFDINNDLRTHLRSFFFEAIDDKPYYAEMEPSAQDKEITKAKNDIIKLISECQAQLSLYELYNPWEFVFTKFLDNHICYFVIYYFSELSQINFDNLSLFQQIRASIEGDIDNAIFSKLCELLNPEVDSSNGAKAYEYPSYIYAAISRYIIWGNSFHQLIGDSDFLSSALDIREEYKNIVIDLLTYAIKRLNLESLEFISGIPLEDICNTAKAQIQYLPQSTKFIRSTANFINTIILSMDNNNDFLQGSGIIPNLLEFLSIPDIDTVNLLIPSLTFLIQNDDQNPENINAILSRISYHFSVKQDFIESDQLVPNLCNAMSKANLEFLGEYLKSLIDVANFQNDANFASAVLSSLSYIKNIPLNIKFEVLTKLEPLYGQDLMPTSNPTLFRNYFLIFYLSSFDIPYPQENQPLSEDLTNILQTIFNIMNNYILQQMNVITNRENLSYQFLKPVRKIISKLRSHGYSFTEIVDAICFELFKLDLFPDEAAKMIAFLIDDESIESVTKVIDALNENIQESRNYLAVDFSLTIISNLNYVSQEQMGQISPLLAGHLLQYYTLISNDLKFDKLIGSLFKAYAKIIPFAAAIPEDSNPINNLPQLIELIQYGDKYTIGCSFHLISAVLNSGQAESFPNLGEYFQNSTAYLPSVLYAPPNEEEKQVLKEISKYYNEFLKSYILLYKDNLAEAFNTLIEVLLHQFEIGYKHSIFIERLIDILIYLNDVGCPPQETVNFFLVPSLSFLFNGNFNQSYINYKKVMENTFRFHDQLIKGGAIGEFREKFEGFLGSLGASERTQEFSQKYYQYFQEQIDPRDLLNNTDVTIFYNSIISDRNSASWGIPQSAPASQS